MDAEMIKSLESLIRYYSNDKLSNVVLELQKELKDKKLTDVESINNKENISSEMLNAALEVKSVMGQINVIIHTLGIINSLPYILDEDEIIESVSLGADNSSSEFDLITNKRIAEFKFITWRGNDSTRLKTTFVDYYNLVEYKTDKDKYLYLIDCNNFKKFLGGRRRFTNILSKNTNIAKEFEEKYKGKYNYINEYYSENCSKVKLISLKDLIPDIFNK